MKTLKQENMETTKNTNSKIEKGTFKNKLVKRMDDFVHFIYKITKNYPKEELYGSTNQLRRASLSVILNYIEGYARRRPATQLTFFETAYGSLKESSYLLDFSKDEGWLYINDYDSAKKLVDEIGAMLWTEIKNLDNSIKLSKH